MKEFFREVTVAEEKAKERAKAATFQAWQTARFYLQGRSKRGMPTLAKALDEVGRTNRPQSLAEMNAALSIIAAQNKWTIQRVSS